MGLDRLTIPQDPGFIDNLVLQRTEPFTTMGGGDALAEWFNTGKKTQLSAFLLQHDALPYFLHRVIEDMQREVTALLAVTGAARRVVSIGPGNGLLEMLLFHQMPYDEILLIDIEQSDAHQHGFHLNGSGYAALQVTKNFMVSNGVPAERIRLCNPLRELLPASPFDLLISMLSMGFHYPCDDYAAFILKNVRPGGWVVFDKRKESDDAGFRDLAAAMTMADRADAEKSARVYLQAAAA